jgi:quercetin dioxygenase-like cupin family protein
MQEYFLSPAERASFRADKPGKVDLFPGSAMFLGLNCFEPGQAQPVHQHAGADKFYLIVSGNARMIVGDETRDAGPGTLIWAPADVPHGVDLAHERTVMLVGIAPPPKR